MLPPSHHLVLLGVPFHMAAFLVGDDIEKFANPAGIAGRNSNLTAEGNIL